MSATIESLEPDPPGVRAHRDPARTAFAGRRTGRQDRARIDYARPAASATVFGNNGRGRDRGVL